jgi:hypothetical protein
VLDMTCNEIRSYFERQEPVAGRGDLAAAVASHLRACPSCGPEFQAQIELLGILNLVRDSAPATSPSLDSAVLESFRARRAYVATPKAVSFFRRPATPLLWRCAIAALVVLAAMILFAYRRSAPRPAMEAGRFVPQASPAKDLPQKGLPQKDSFQNALSSNAAANPPARQSPVPVGPNLRTARTARTERTERTAQTATRRTALAANQRHAWPVDFNGLMYCDSLSCSEGMEIIRMQLPAPPPQSPGAAGAHNPVFADVVVGPDGIARGFRMVR